MVDAAVGTNVVRVDSRGGRDRVPAGTQPRDVLVVRGKGVPSLGPGAAVIFACTRVRVPRRLTPEQREQLPRAAARSTDDAYESDDGFFQRLKSAFR